MVVRDHQQRLWQAVQLDRLPKAEVLLVAVCHAQSKLRQVPACVAGTRFRIVFHFPDQVLSSRGLETAQ